MGNENSNSTDGVKQDNNTSEDTTTTNDIISERTESGGLRYIDSKYENEATLDLKDLEELAKVISLEPYQNCVIGLFDSDRDGLSVSALSQSILDNGPIIIVITSKTGQIFGGYCSVSIVRSNNFHGTSDCFLYYKEKAATNSNSTTTDEGKEKQQQEKKSLHIYPGTTKFNENFQFFNHSNEFMKYDGFGMGGMLLEEDMIVFHLSISSTLKTGVTQSKLLTFPKCPCISNPTTTRPIDNFEIERLEVLGFPLSEEQNNRKEFEKQQKDYICQAKREDYKVDKQLGLVGQTVETAPCETAPDDM